MLLAACGRESAPAPGATPDAPAAVPAPAQAAERPAPAPKGRKLPEALPESVQLAFPYHFRSQRIVDTPSGRQERRLTVEFLDGDVDGTVASLGDSLRQAGFRLVREQAFDDGRRRLVFGKKGFGRVTAVVAPQAGRKLRNRAARGTVYMVWPVAAAPAAAPATGG